MLQVASFTGASVILKTYIGWQSPAIIAVARTSHTSLVSDMEKGSGAGVVVSALRISPIQKRKLEMRHWLQAASFTGVSGILVILIESLLHAVNVARNTRRMLPQSKQDFVGDAPCERNLTMRFYLLARLSTGQRAHLGRILELSAKCLLRAAGRVAG
jgi:hypothetical protein